MDSKRSMFVNKRLQSVVIAGEQSNGITGRVAEQRRRAQISAELVVVEVTPLTSTDAVCRLAMLELKTDGQRDE